MSDKPAANPAPPPELPALEWSRREWADPHGRYCLNSQHFDFGAADSKGRKVGVFATIRATYPSVWERNADGSEHDRLTGPMHYVVSTRATRDGAGFGADPHGTIVADLAEAKTLATRKVVEAKRRFEKLATKGEGRQWSKETR